MRFYIFILFFGVSTFSYAQDIKRTKNIASSKVLLNSSTQKANFSILSSDKKTVNMATANTQKSALKSLEINTNIPKIKVKSTSTKQKNINTVYKASEGGPYYIPGSGGYGFCIPRF